MKIIVAPDSFKGSISSTEAAAAIHRGLLAGSSNLDITSIPMADGGEGTVEALTMILEGRLIKKEVTDPLGRRVNASYGWVESSKTAIVETAAASGLPLLTKEELHPLSATTYGTGELLEDALDRGAETIILGLGGSATVDAGTGCFQALGATFHNAKGERLDMNGRELGNVASINTNQLHNRVQNVHWIIASDVTNPLLGEEGAVSVFGPQKGVQQEQQEAFESNMTHYADVLEAHLGQKLRDKEGSGAAGGFGFTLYGLLPHSTVQSGFQLIAQWSHLHERIKGADLVLTGEGKLDEQSLYGKVPVGIARIAKTYNVPCVAFAGTIEGDVSGSKQEGLLTVLPIVDAPMSLEEAMERGDMLLQRAATRFMEIRKLDTNNTLGEVTP
ncbi:glycerate kinase [Pontibacillus salicampi]|uniref:Glycerate kinase n=1 Tax=Pontibacillus salicampi TaxID=1449801 RepID=A0ABV6LQN5_9BACI